MRCLWLLLRRLIPHRLRWFYEGHIQIPGQLWYAERKTLYETIRKHKPQVVFEIGTWFGGGSTYFIAQALLENHFGTLFTIESDQDIYRSAVLNYHRYLRNLLPYIKFYVGKSTEVYPLILREVGRVDALFLDGADDPQQTVDEFTMFKPYLHRGSVLMAHDWDQKKMELLRSIIETSPNWMVEQVLTKPLSVGFAVYRYLGGD